jgi:hypothetical protein
MLQVVRLGQTLDVLRVSAAEKLLLLCCTKYMMIEDYSLIGLSSQIGPCKTLRCVERQAETRQMRWQSAGSDPVGHSIEMLRA